MKKFMRGRMFDRREILNGEEVLWFDGAEPYYAVFKNYKLKSFYIDKETIARRAEEARRYDEELKQGQEDFERAQNESQVREQEYNERRRQNLLKILGNSFKPMPAPYQIPVNRPVNTNCQRNGNQVNCQSY